MNRIDATIQFVPEKLQLEFVQIFLERYTDPLTGWATAHWNDGAKTRIRNASVFDKSIEPITDGVYDSDGNLLSGGDHKIIRCLWPEQFIADIESGTDPLMEGITILEIYP